MQYATAETIKDEPIRRYGSGVTVRPATQADALQVARELRVEDVNEMRSIMGPDVAMSVVLQRHVMEADLAFTVCKEEHPVAVQFGGSSPQELSQCSIHDEKKGYHEVNLNIGCPSERVQKGNFGVCLMLEPDLVAECTRKMSKSVDIPITVKCRTGVDDNDDYEFLKSFISTVKDSGVKTFIIHARKAILGKFTPKQNLNIPPLKYNIVYQLKENFPNDEIIINGGITSTAQIKDHLKKVDGAMLGRSVYHSPYLLAEIEKEIFNNENYPSRQEVVERLIEYLKKEVNKGTRVNQIMRHTLGLFHGQTGSSYWKRYLSENMCIREADLQKVNHIMDHIKNNGSTTSLGR